MVSFLMGIETHIYILNLAYGGKKRDGEKKRIRRERN